MKKRGMKKKCLTAVLCALAISTTAMAAPSNEELHQMILDTQKQIIDAQTEAETNSHIKFSEKTGMPEWQSADGKSSFAIGGRITTDMAWIPEMYGKGKLSKYQDSQRKNEIRKLYLSAEGQFSDVWEYELQFDFAGNTVEVQDANVTYTGLKNNEFTIGWQKTRYGMESTTSSKDLTYMERGLTDTFSPERGIGFLWTHKYRMGITQLSYLMPNGSEETDDDDDPQFRADADTILGRVTFVPMDDSDQILHFGVNGGYYHYDDKALPLEFTARPESHLSETLVAVEFDDPDRDIRYALEAAYSGHGFLIAAEYAGAVVETEDSKDYSFNAWYLSASYMLTGESHKYKKSSGYFKEVMPDNPISKGGYGAWELSARYSGVNLTDDDVYGGDLRDITIGLHWYLENNLKFVLEYVGYDADNYKDDPEKYVESQDGGIVQARLQLYF